MATVLYKLHEEVVIIDECMRGKTNIGCNIFYWESHWICVVKLAGQQ